MTAAPTTHVVAVVVSTNERRWLRTCLGSLLDSDPGPGVQLDVVLVDNASTDGGPDLVRDAFTAVEVVRSSTNLGFAGANNVGMSRALARGADHVLMLNPDTRTPRGMVRDLVAFLDRWPRYGIVGPLQLVYTEDGRDTDEPNAWSREALWAGEAHIFANDGVDKPSPAGDDDGRAPGTLEHAYVQGAALMCRTAVLRDVGLLDERYHTYYEESDLCRRARWAGWRVALVLDVGVQHYGGGTGSSPYRRRHMLRNKYYFLLTDPGWPLPEAFRLAARWLRSDLRGLGPAAAATRAAAVGDTLAGLGWLLRSLPAIRVRRRAHRRLRGTGAPRTTPPEEVR